MKAHRLFVVAVLGLAVVCSPARASDTFRFDPAQSSISFKIRHLLGSAKGRFTKFNGTIEIDRNHPEQSSVIATIQVMSIDTANAKRDEHLRSEDFFNVRKFPEIIFKSRRVKQTGSNAGEIAGDLTMHGITRPVTLQVQLVGSPESAAKSQRTRWRVTTAPLKRSDFTLGSRKGAFSVIGNEVAVDIQIEANRVE